MFEFLLNLGDDHVAVRDSGGAAHRPAPPPPAPQGSPVLLALSGHWLQGRGSWKELKKYHMTQAMMVL